MAFLHSLPWFRSLVDGGVILSSPSNIIHILPPQRLNNLTGLWPGEGILDVVFPKERGPQLPVAELFEAGLLALGLDLALGDFFDLIPMKAWSFWPIFVGVVPLEKLPAQGMIRSYVIYGIYEILLGMWYQKDFRSGAFKVTFNDYQVCDIIIYPEDSSELKNHPSFAHVTNLTTLSSPIVHHTNSSSKLVASALESDLEIQVQRSEPFRPLGQSELLLSLMDMVVNAAEPSKDEFVQKSTEDHVLLTGVKTSINVSVDARPPRALTYGDIIKAAVFLSENIDLGEEYSLAATTATLSRDGFYVGEIRLEPFSSSASARPLIEANVGASADTATARQKRSMARRLWHAERG